MIRNCKINQRVRIVPKTFIGSESRDKGVVTMSFDLRKGDTGTVIRRIYGSLVVKLDAPNFGELWVRPSEVERLLDASSLEEEQC